MNKNLDWKPKTILVGAIIGAVTGVVAAMILIQRAEKQETQPQLSAGEGVKLGLGVLGLLRLVSDFVDGK